MSEANGHVEKNSSGSTSSTSSDVTSDLTDSAPDLRYGCCFARPSWLQWLNNIAGAVAFISLANCMQSIANGLYGVVLSTIERQFDLTSSQSSWIAVGYEIGGMPILILISILGTRIHRPISLALGLFSVTLGCVLFFIPQFTTPAYKPVTSRPDGLCASNGSLSSSTACGDDDESLSYYLPLFVISRLLIGMGAAPIITVGVNYMDDCSTKEKFAKYCGIFMAMSVIGPAIGFVFGAVTLEVFTDFYLFSKDEIGIDSSDPNWIGCWWLPYIVAAGLCLLNAIPMWGYPRDLPGAAEIRAQKVTEAHKDNQDGGVSPSTELSYARSFSEFGALAKAVLTNPTYLALTLFASCDNFIIAGFTAFGPKYFEFGFAMSPALAGVMFGVVLLPAGAGGTIVGGLVIEKMKLTCRAIIRIQAVLAGLVTAGCFLFILICDSETFAGVNASYNTSWPVDMTSIDLLDTCNGNCSCDEVAYEPICSHDRVQYFSPCHAGCTFRNKSADSGYNFYDCSCITSMPEDISLPLASSGQCTSGVCSEAIVFLVGFFIAVFAIFFCITTNTSATLRCVTGSQTAFALGVQVLFVKLLGMLPGPLMMGVAFDNTCVLWTTLPCSDSSGSCAFYDNAALSKNFIILTTCVKFVSFVAMTLAVALYRPPKAVAAIGTTMDGDCDHDDVGEMKGERDKKNGTASWSSVEESSKMTKIDETPNAAFSHDDNPDFESVQL